MPILLLGVKARDVDSFSTDAHPALSTMKDSLKAQVEVAPPLVVEVVHTKPILDLMVASSSIPTSTTTVTTLVLETMPDSLPFKPLVEARTASASVVLCLPLLVLVLLVSVSGTPVLDLEATLR